jgi:hypothetical protein
MYIRKVGCEEGASLNLTQDGVQWQAVLNTVMHLQILSKAGSATVRFCFLRAVL